MTPKVSIIVPVYKVEKYLTQCLNSLVRQTLCDIEILVVNDGSPDNSQLIIDNFVKRYPDMIRAFNKPNGGLSDARNYAIQYAQGEYIGFVDSDDYVREDMFELLYKQAKDQNADIAVCNYYKVDNDGRIEERHIISHESFFNQNVESSPQLLLESKSYAWNKLYRREWYLKNAFMFPRNQWFEDSAVVYNMLYKANRVTCVTDCLYFYRNTRSDSITNQVNDKRLLDIFKSCESIRIFFYGHTCNKEVIDVVDRVCQIHLFIRLQHLYKRGTFKAKLRYYHELVNYLERYMPLWTQNPYYKKVKKQSAYMNHINKPILMYSSFLIPNKIMDRFRRRPVLKAKASTDNYINHVRLKELQNIELSILKAIDSVCKRYQINYYLNGESLLGAMRHQGFIPWSERLEIALFRDDYNKLISYLTNELDKSYYVVNVTNLPSCYFQYTKVISADKHGFTNKTDKLPKKYLGPFINIYPLDYCKSTEKKALSQQYKRIDRLNKQLKLKAGKIQPNTWKLKLQKFFVSFKSFERLHKQLLGYMQTTVNTSDFACNFTSSDNTSRKVIPKDLLGKPKYVSFEDCQLPVPEKAHELLTTLYGSDYMRMPSVLKRKCKHIYHDEVSIKGSSETVPVENAQMTKAAMEEARQLQLYELDILKEVDRVCQENGITYYLGEGTLLGAIRHKGFIPWDDDVDIVMFRADMKKFIEIADQKLKPNYKLQFYHNIKSYWVQSPKVRLLDQTAFSQNELKRYTPDTGPYIDIFPLDYAPPSYKKLNKQNQYIKRYRRILFLKTGFAKIKRKNDRINKIFARFLSCKRIHELINRKAEKYNRVPSREVCNFGSYYPICNELFPVEAFGKPIYVPFEDAMFPVPSNAKYILKTTYGDYMQLPPEDKRIPHHHFD